MTKKKKKKEKEHERKKTAFYFSMFNGTLFLLFEQGASYFHFALRLENYGAGPVFKYRGTVKFMMVGTCFQNYDFNLKAQILPLATNTVRCFP